MHPLPSSKDPPRLDTRQSMQVMFTSWGIPVQVELKKKQLPVRSTGVGAGLGVGVGRGVCVAVAVADTAAVAVAVAVAVGGGLDVGVTVAVAVAVAVAVGDGDTHGPAATLLSTTLVSPVIPSNPVTTISRFPIAVPPVKECATLVFGPLLQLSPTVS